jgi:transcription termination factor NusB
MICKSVLDTPEYKAQQLKQGLSGSRAVGVLSALTGTKALPPALAEMVASILRDYEDSTKTLSEMLDGEWKSDQLENANASLPPAV